MYKKILEYKKIEKKITFLEITHFDKSKKIEENMQKIDKLLKHTIKGIDDKWHICSATTYNYSSTLSEFKISVFVKHTIDLLVMGGKENKEKTIYTNSFGNNLFLDENKSTHHQDLKNALENIKKEVKNILSQESEFSLTLSSLRKEKENIEKEIYDTLRIIFDENFKNKLFSELMSKNIIYSHQAKECNLYFKIGETWNEKGSFAYCYFGLKYQYQYEAVSLGRIIFVDENKIKWKQLIFDTNIKNLYIKKWCSTTLGNLFKKALKDG